MTYDFDLIVIGAGSGGLAGAKRAAQYGAKVAIIENDRVGGTCVIRGCVPKKIMSYAAHTADTLADAHGYGFNLDVSFDFKKFAEARNTEIDRLEGLHKTFLDKAGVTLLNGKGVLTGAHEVTIDDQQTITGKYIMLATGGHPTKPPVKGAEHGFISDGVFDLTELPKKMVIVGGGYIGVEFASIFNALGTEVHLVLRRDVMLAGFDQDIRDHLTNELKKRGVIFHCICNTETITPKGNQKLVKLDTGDELLVDEVLFATGRKPNTSCFDIDLPVCDNGAVIVNNKLQTQGEHKHIYAVGDLTDRVNLTPVAIRDGRMIAENLFNDGDFSLDDGDIATAVFSIPPLGTCGLTEALACEEYGEDNIKVFKTTFRPMVNVLPNRDEKMFMKAIYHKKTDKLIGAHLMGRDAPEMVQFIGTCIKAGVTHKQMLQTMPLHPSSAEEFVLLK